MAFLLCELPPGALLRSPALPLSPPSASSSPFSLRIRVSSPSLAVFRGAAMESKEPRLSPLSCPSSSLPYIPAHIDSINSPNNPFVKHCVRLRREGNYRKQAKSLLVVGETPLREICQWFMERPGHNSDPIIGILFLLQGTDVPISVVRLAKRIVKVAPSVMAKLAGVESLSSGEALAGVLSLPDTFTDVAAMKEGDQSLWCPTGTRILALDGIQDPGNIGTLLRTAAAFAWDGVFLLPGCCDPFNEKALRAARGATFRVPIAMGEWSHLEELTSVRGLTLYAGDPDTEEAQSIEELVSECDSSFTRYEKSGPNGSRSTLTAASTEERLCLVLGSEGRGLSEEAKGRCRGITIPMPGGFESLNVAVAGGILLYILKNKKLRSI